MASFGMHYLPSRATVERFNICGHEHWTIFGSGEVWQGGHVSLPLTDVDALVRVLAPEVIDALHKALPIVAALCGALAETCDEEAASTLALLIDLTGRFPAEAVA